MATGGLKTASRLNRVTCLFIVQPGVINKEMIAGNEVRTRDLLLGKQALYQLSYTRLGQSAERKVVQDLLAVIQILAKPSLNR